MFRFALSRDFLRFGIVGIFNVTITFVVFNALMFVVGATTGIVVGIAYLFAHIVGIANSFFWNKRWVFNHEEKKQIRIEFIRFTGITITVALACSWFVYILTTYATPPGVGLRLWANIAALGAIPVSAFGNFFGYKLFVFKKTKN